MRLATTFVLSTLLAATGCPAGDDTTTGADASTTAEASSSDDASGTDTGSTGSTTETADETGPAISGEELFLSVCAPCHGQEGEGTALGYALQHPVRDYSTWVVRNGRPPGNEELPGSAMAAYAEATVSDAQLEEIWDYLDAFPQPTTGQALYFDYCRNCHGEDAAGGVTGVNLRDEIEGFADVLENVREGEDAPYEMRSLYMPGFAATVLTDAEVQLIADHIASL